MNELQRAFNKVLLDGQAYLYALNLEAKAKKAGQEVTEDMFKNWEDDWKLQAQELVSEILTPREDEQRWEEEGGAF